MSNKRKNPADERVALGKLLSTKQRREDAQDIITIRSREKGERVSLESILKRYPIK